MMTDNGVTSARLSNTKPQRTSVESGAEKRTNGAKVVNQFPIQRENLKKEKSGKITRSALQKHIRLIKSKLHRRQHILRIKVLMQEEFEDKYVQLNQAGFESDDDSDDFYPKKKKQEEAFVDEKDIDQEWDFGDDDEPGQQALQESPQESKRISIIEELYR